MSDRHAEAAEKFVPHPVWYGDNPEMLARRAEQIADIAADRRELEAATWEAAAFEANLAAKVGMSVKAFADACSAKAAAVRQGGSRE